MTKRFNELSKTFSIVEGDISDGYHTFDELYTHRVSLFIALCKLTSFRSFYKKDYSEWFCLYLETSEGQISYHLPNRYLDLIQEFAIQSPDHVWDGHTPKDVVDRLERLTKSFSTYYGAQKAQD